MMFLVAPNSFALVESLLVVTSTNLANVAREELEVSYEFYRLIVPLHFLQRSVPSDVNMM
jgi:hypothetical protein